MGKLDALMRYGRILFLFTAGAVVAMFLYFSDQLLHDLSQQERERMEIWADAVKEIVKATSPPEEAADSAGYAEMPAMGTDIDFLLRIINRNHTIPVLLTDDSGNILQHNNFDLPEPVDSLSPLSEANEAYLKQKLRDLASSQRVIDIEVGPGSWQHLYYEDSKPLKRIAYYPYIQLLVMLAFVAIVYFAVLSTKKAEQNRVWVGLSKETAHQLGTPISSLMAWLELLPDMGVDSDTVNEMNKDVTRLSTIASRFSKIGSKPSMESGFVNSIVADAVGYMSTRISPRITLTGHISGQSMPVMACVPLIEWVMENLIKNAVDAMDGRGSITVDAHPEDNMAVIEVTDTGKGLSRKNFKTVFNPGFTTKKRGWGLGLTLARRIVEQYHSGRIFVKSSTPGVGTTFRIELPLSAPANTPSAQSF